MNIHNVHEFRLFRDSFWSFQTVSKEGDIIKIVGMVDFKDYE